MDMFGADSEKSHRLRDTQQHLNDLKKENFSLKLRIYFLEERIKGLNHDQDLTKTNIELNVQLQRLKKELEAKHTLSTAKLLSNQNTEEQQQPDESTNQIQESLQVQIHLLPQELEKRRQQSETSESLLQRQALYKDRLISALMKEKDTLQTQVQDLSSALRKRPHSDQNQCGQTDHSQLKRVMEEQTLQLDHCESTTDQCLSELKTAQKHVQSLQTKIQLSEERNKILKQRLGEMELELRAVREEAQNQERNLQNLSDSLSSKEQEAADLYRVIEEQNQTLCSVKETTHKQMSTGESLSVQSELSSLHLVLFRSRLDSDGLQRGLRTRERLQTDLRVALERAEADIQGVLERGRERLQHNQELKACVDRLRSSLRESQDKLQEAQTQNLRLKQDLARTISGLREKLRTQDQHVQDYRDLLQSEDQDSELLKLKEMIHHRDLQLECVIEEKAQMLKENDQEKLQLQDQLRDNHQDLRTSTEVLQRNQETIRSLEVLVRGQSLQMEQLTDSLRESGLNQDRVQTELNHVLKEKDSVILGLQEVLQQRDLEIQDLNSALVKTWSGPAEILIQAQLRLQLKDRLLQEVMSERSRQARDQEDRVQTLVLTIDQRDQYIQDLSPRLLELLKEQSDRISELRTQLSQGPKPDQDLDQYLSQDQIWTLRNQRDHIQRELEDKNRLIKELVCELRSLRGRLGSDYAQDQGLILGSEQDKSSTASGGVSEEEEADADEDSALTQTKSVSFSDPGLVELVEQKRAVDRELNELKTQLQLTGFTSLSQIRKALLDLRTQNQELRLQLRQNQDVEEQSDQWEGWDQELIFDPSQADARVNQMSRPRHGGGAVVDLGYETCERSETEAERDTSSPEFDDLEMCLSLDYGSRWFNLNKNSDQTQRHGEDPQRPGEDLQGPMQDPQRPREDLQRPMQDPQRPREDLQTLVDHLKSELNRSQIQVQKLQTRLKSRSEVHLDPDFADLLNRVESLENQVKTRTRTEAEDLRKTGYLGLVQVQARELVHLRQVLRESRGLVQILVQNLSESIKSFESLLSSSDVDYSLSQGLREQLQESQEVLQRISCKISLKDLPEDPDDKTELLAMRLSAELQQKDQLIESLQFKLHSDTPTDSSDQSDCFSYVTDEQLSNHDDDLGSETNSELNLDQSQRSDHTDCQSSAPPSVASAHSFPSMPCFDSLYTPGHSHTGPLSFRPSLPFLTRLQDSPQSLPAFSHSSLHGAGFSPGFSPGPGFSSSSLPLCPSLWDSPFMSRPLGGQLSTSACSFHSLPGSELLGEHLTEVRSLRHRLEESIQTNDRLRTQLEARLDTPRHTAPTNIYIQGLESVGPLSSEVRVLRETNSSLQTKLRESSLEADRLSEALLLVRTRLKEVELSRTSQSEAQRQEVLQLKQERHRNLELINRLHDEGSVLQQQLKQSHSLVQSLQEKIQNSQSEPSDGGMSQSEQSEGARTQSEERRVRRLLQFTVISPVQTGPDPVQPGPDLVQPGPDSDLVLVSVQDFVSLQQNLQDSLDLLKSIHKTLQTTCDVVHKHRNHRLRTGNKPDQVQTRTRTKTLIQDCERLVEILTESHSLSTKFTVTQEHSQQEQCLKEEVLTLREKLSERDRTLKEVTDELHRENTSKRALDLLLLSQLSRTRDVLKKATTNLQVTRAAVS